MPKSATQSDQLQRERAATFAAMREAKTALDAAASDPSSPWVLAAFDDGAPGARVGSTSEGVDVLIFPGTVTFLNQPGADFDYRVKVEVVSGGRGGVEVVSVEAMKRPGGRRMTVRALSDDSPGRFHRRAVEELVSPDTVVPHKVHGAGDAVTRHTVAVSPGRAPGVTAEELDAVAELEAEAESKGKKMHEHVRRGLAARFDPPASADRWTVNHVKYRLDLLTEAGRRERRGRGRPRKR